MATIDDFKIRMAVLLHLACSHSSMVCLCLCLCLNHNLKFRKIVVNNTHIVMNINKRTVEKKLARSCLGFICCFEDAVLSVVGVVGSEGRKQRERVGTRDDYS